MSDSSLVSVLMPVYNAATYFSESLKSIIDQSYQELEIIVVDDGCSDDSIDVAYSFGDPRIVVVRNTGNLGLAASLNQSIAIARGSLLARMDADDIAREDRIELQVDFMRKNPQVDVLGSALRYFGHSRYLNFFPFSHEDCRARLLFNVCFGHPSVILRKNVFERTGIYFDEKLRQYSEEYDLWCRLADVAKFANLPDALMRYRTYNSNEKKDAERMRLTHSETIRRRYLVDHLGEVSGEEWLTHQQAAFARETTSLNDLKRIDAWFSALLARNGQHSAFEDDALKRQLAIQFFELCYHYAGLGWPSYSLFQRSRWAQAYTWRGLQRVKYLAKSLLSVQPR